MTTGIVFLVGGVVGGVVTAKLDDGWFGRAWWSWVLGFATYAVCSYIGGVLR